MAVTDIAICNLALSWLGGNPIASLTNDDSVEEILCGDNYELCRSIVMAARNWSFATYRDTLDSPTSNPEHGFTYYFSLPTGTIRVIQADSDEDMEEGADWAVEGDYLYCDDATFYIKFLKEITDPTKFSPGFIDALAAKLAWNIALPLTGSIKMSDKMEAKYIALMEEGSNIDALQGKNKDLRTSKLIQARYQ